MGKVVPENSQGADRDPSSAKEDIGGLSLKLKEALQGRESKESLRKIGDSLYESFRSHDYTPEMVLSSIKEIFEENKNNLDPVPNLNAFIQSFGPGLVKLVQQKLLEHGGFDLGKYGPRNDGVDGKLGKMTGSAINRYFEKAQPAESPPVDAAETTAHAKSTTPAVSTESRTAPRQSEQPPAVRVVSDQGPDMGPYKPGTERPTFTPLGPLRTRIKEIYDQQPSTYTTDTMPNQLGRTRDRIEPYLTNVDPDTGGPLTFLGAPFMKPPGGGLNLLAIPFLKIAEKKISDAKINYKPAIKKYKGYDFRGLKIGGVPSDKIMSSHSFGMAFDIDPTENMPESNNGRGNIPDEVVMALVDSGFAWGSVPHEGFHFKVDPMHFQLRFDPRDAAGQAIIKASDVGTKYWEKVRPLLENVQNATLA